MARSRYLLDKKMDTIPSHRFQTRVDGNGPIRFIDVNKAGPFQPPNFIQVEAAKAYLCCNANGILPYRSAPLVVEGKRLDDGFLQSQVLYDIFSASDLHLERMLEMYPITEAMNFSIEKALDFGDLMLIVSAAEANKTVAMIRQVFVRFFRFLLGLYNSVKRLSPRKAYDVLSNAWLEARYGWRPLFLEMKALYELITREEGYEVRSSYGKAAFENSDFEFEVDTPLHTPDQVIYAEHNVKVRNIYHKVGFNYVNSYDSRNGDTLAQLGSDLESLLVTAWELIPFSFILDMFVNIGSCLGAFNWRNEIKPFNSYVSTSMDVSVETSYGSVYSGRSTPNVTWILDDYHRGKAGLERASESFFSGFCHNHYAIEYVTQSGYESLHVRPLEIHSIDSFSFPIKPLYGADGTLLDDGVHFNYADRSYIGTNAHGYYSSQQVLFPQTRHYTYTNKSGAVVTETHTVGVPVPKGLVKQLFPKEEDFSSHRERILAFFASRQDQNGTYHPEKRPETNSLGEHYHYTFLDSLRKRSLPTHIFQMKSEYNTSTGRYRHWLEPYDRPASNGYRIVTVDRNVLPYSSLLPPPARKILYHGTVFQRRVIDPNSLEFNLYFDIDLNKSQVVDLLIFAERLLSFFLKGKPK